MYLSVFLCFYSKNLYLFAPNIFGWIDPLGLAVGPSSVEEMAEEWASQINKNSVNFSTPIRKLTSMKGRRAVVK